MWKSRSLVAALAAFSVVALAPRPAAGATISFAGSITSVDAALSGFFSVGAAISGSYTFNYPVANCGDAVDCDYTGQISALSATFDGYTTTLSAPQNLIEVRNNSGGGGNQDLYRVKVNVSGATLGVYAPSTFELLLIDNTGAALSSTDLPGTLPDFTQFGLNDLNLVFCSAAAGCGTAKALVTGDQVPVPEPATLLLLGLGLGVAGARLRRKA